ncbi:MAG TPA: PAS domain S-box protein, partial [Coleofasciculaceae cyanobacterium]
MELNKELEPVFTNLNTIKALMVTVDRQGRIVAFNKVCEQLTGYSFNEVRGRYIWDLFLIPEEVEPFKAVCENLKAGNCAEYNYESYWVTKDGHHRRIAWSNSALFNNEGAIEYVIGTGIDINERRLLFERHFTNPCSVRRSKTRRVGGLVGEPFCVREARNLYEDEQGPTSVESRTRYRQPWANELNQHNRRIQLLSLVALKIRQSLELEEILQSTVTEVRNLLQADRVLIYRLWSDGTGSAVTEAVIPGWPSILGQTFEPEVFPEEYHQLYACGRVGAIDALETA